MYFCKFVLISWWYFKYNFVNWYIYKYMDAFLTSLGNSISDSSSKGKFWDSVTNQIEQNSVLMLILTICKQTNKMSLCSLPKVVWTLWSCCFQWNLPAHYSTKFIFFKLIMLYTIRSEILCSFRITSETLPENQSLGQ